MCGQASVCTKGHTRVTGGRSSCAPAPSWAGGVAGLQLLKLWALVSRGLCS